MTSRHLPGFQSPVYKLTDTRALRGMEVTLAQVKEYVGRYDDKQSEHIRLQAPWWPNALIAGASENRKADILGLLSTAYTGEGTDNFSEDVEDGVQRAAQYSIGRMLTFNEVQALVLRNLSFIHQAQVRQTVTMGYYYSQMAFLAYFLVTWDMLQAEPPEDKRYQFRLS